MMEQPRSFTKRNPHQRHTTSHSWQLPARLGLKFAWNLHFGYKTGDGGSRRDWLCRTISPNQSNLKDPGLHSAVPSSPTQWGSSQADRMISVSATILLSALIAAARVIRSAFALTCFLAAKTPQDGPDSPFRTAQMVTVERNHQGDGVDFFLSFRSCFLFERNQALGGTARRGHLPLSA